MYPYTWRRLPLEPCVAVLPDWRNGARFGSGVTGRGTADDGEHEVEDDDQPTSNDEVSCETKPVMRIIELACEKLTEELGSREPEHACVLLGPRDSDIVTHFVADENGKATRSSFTLDVDWLNRVIRRYVRCGIDVKGVVHSHPSGVPSPSQGDLAYVRSVFATPKNDDADELLLPIFCDGNLHPFVVVRGIPLRVRTAELVLI